MLMKKKITKTQTVFITKDFVSVQIRSYGTGSIMCKMEVSQSSIYGPQIHIRIFMIVKYLTFKNEVFFGFYIYTFCAHFMTG